jgi:hypothetical protein
VDHVEEVHGAAGFVCLEVSHEVPANIGPTNGRNLLFRLLNTILAEVSSPEFDQILYQAGRVGLADGNQRDLARVSAAALGSGVNSGLNVRKSCGKTFRRVNIRHHGNQFDTES